MDKKIAGLLGAAAALATVSAAHASTQPQSNALTPATSYRDLLDPVSNALALMKADDAARARQQPAQVQLAQHHHHHHGFFHHHHHHHHGFFHHHHHHHHGFFGGFIPLPGIYGPHCYWTLGRPYWNGYRWIRRRVRVCD